MRSFRAAQIELSPVARILFMALAFAALGCFQTQSQTMNINTSILGIWSGTSTASCTFPYTRPGRCNAQQKITLLIIKKTNGYGGQYSCAYGNMVCRNANESGQIVAVTSPGGSLEQIRVELPDGTSCLYTGGFQTHQVKGTYACYGGASIIEQGYWQASFLS
jgi:hypothetical protein